MDIKKIIIALLLIFTLQQKLSPSGIPPENHESETTQVPQSFLAKIAMIPSKVASGTLTVASVGAVLGSTVGCVIFARQWGRLAQITMNKRISRTLGITSALMTLYALQTSFKNYREKTGDVYLMSIGLFAGLSYGLLVPFRIPIGMIRITGTQIRPAQPLPPGPEYPA